MENGSTMRPVLRAPETDFPHVVIVRSPHDSPPSSRRLNSFGLPWSVIEVEPVSSMAFTDSSEVEHALHRIAQSVDVAEGLTILAEGDAIPFALALGTHSDAVGSLLLFPALRTDSRLLTGVASMIRHSHGQPSVLLAFPPRDGGSNGPRNDEWLKVLARSQLARWSHFDYLAAHPWCIAEPAPLGELEKLIRTANRLHRNRLAICALECSTDSRKGSADYEEARSTYQGIIAARLAGLDPDSLPEWLHDKLLTKEHAITHDLPVTPLREVLDTPEALELHHFDKPCVVKPVRGSSSLGVKILHRNGDHLTDLGSGDTFDIQQLRDLETNVLDRIGDTRAPALLLEEPVRDATGRISSRDYKFLFAGDAIVLVHVVERTDRGVVSQWMDADFRPVIPGPVWTNTYFRKVGQFEKPAEWPALVELARRVYESAGLPLTRVDLYLGAQGPIFGEITPMPGNFYFGDADKLSVGTATRTTNLTHNSLPSHRRNIVNHN